MKTLVTTLTERGQVSVPSAIRKKLHLKPGQHLVWQAVGDSECRVIVEEANHKPRGARAMLGFGKQFRETKSTAEWMKELREGEEL
jgi:AbrB family looped-hinge helix DNA binding protein